MIEVVALLIQQNKCVDSLPLTHRGAKRMSVTSELSSDAGVLTIRVSGRFDFSSHQEFRKAYETVSQSSISYVIDMGEAEYLDSSALMLLPDA